MANIKRMKSMVKKTKNVKKREEGKLKNIIVQSPQARYSINYRFFPSPLSVRASSVFSLSSLWKLDVNT